MTGFTVKHLATATKSNWVSQRKQPHFHSDYNFQFCVSVKISNDAFKYYQEIAMGKYKTKTIMADLGIFIHMPAYSDIPRHIQPDIIRHIHSPVLCNPDIFRTLADSEPSIFRTRARHIHDHDSDIFRIQPQW